MALFFTIFFAIWSIICFICIICNMDFVKYVIAELCCVVMVVVCASNIDYYPSTYFEDMGVINYEDKMSVREQEFLYALFTKSADCTANSDSAEEKCHALRPIRMTSLGAFINTRIDKPSEQATPFCDAGATLYEMERASKQKFLPKRDRQMFNAIWWTVKDGDKVEGDWSLRRRQWYNYVIVNGCDYGDQPEIAYLDPDTGDRIEPGATVVPVEPIPEIRNDKGNGIDVVEESGIQGISIDDMERLKEQSKTCKPARDRILDAMIDKGSLDTSDWDSVSKAVNYCQNVDLANLVKE